jgi:SOS-response transcriptional repressor LexA
MRRKAREPTRTQLDVYRYIFNFTCQNGWQPTLRETADHFGLSHSTVNWFVLALEELGWVGCRESSARAIRFLKTPDGEAFVGFQSIKPPQGLSDGAGI